MTNKALLLLSCLVLTSFFSANAQSIFTKWDQLSDYHDVMAATFHPAEEGDVYPIKTRSVELVKTGKKLVKGSIPAEFASTEMEDILKDLYKDSKALNKMIKKGKASDEQIKQGIIDLHEVFHQIVGLCKREEHS